MVSIGVTFFFKLNIEKDLAIERVVLLNVKIRIILNKINNYRNKYTI